MPIKLCCLLAIGFCAFSLTVRAGELDSYTLVKLKHGPNDVDINNDGVKDLVVLARRENFNAWSVDIATICVQITPSEYWWDRWNIVSILKGISEVFTLRASAVDEFCSLEDFRVLKPKKGRQSLLILAHKDTSEGGNVFYRRNFVTFDYYHLIINMGEDPVGPAVYFDYVKSVTSKDKHCSVNEAFESELGLGNYIERNN